MHIRLDEYGNEIVGNKMNAIDEETGLPVTFKVMRRLSDGRIFFRFDKQIYSFKRTSGIPIARRAWAAGNKNYDSATDLAVEKHFAQKLIPESAIRKNIEMDKEISEAMEKCGISIDSFRKFEINRWEMVKEDPFQLIRFVTMVTRKFFVNQKRLVEWLFLRKSITFPINNRQQAWVALRLAAMWHEINWENMHPELKSEKDNICGKNTKPLCQCQKKPTE